jgi:hydrogenase maturation protease
MRILVLAWGNPGRCDDGLGPALAARLEQIQLPGVAVESDYQLTIEHAALAAEYDVVVFADAAQDAQSSYYFRPVTPADASRFTTHGVTPGEILFLARSCFGAMPEGHLLGIRAHVLDQFGEELSAAALEDLDAAVDFLCEWITLKQGSQEKRPPG